VSLTADPVDQENEMSNQVGTTDAIIFALINQNSESEGTGGRSKSWLVAIAKALGGILGDKAAKLVELSKELETLAAKGDDKESARAFQETMTEFQAQSQLFNMISNTASTAIKSIGEGMTAVARKQ
jgi:hypothetical protein